MTRLAGRALLSIAAAALLSGCSDETLSPACTTDCFDGLTASVELRRDPLGVVHVYGSTDADVFFGSGYAQATDRLFQMDLTRRQALGRRAEVLGESALGDDMLLRRFGIAQMGAANAALALEENPEAAELFIAWVAGVNKRIDEVHAGEAPLPYGFAELDYLPERWSTADAAAVGKMILFGNANQIEVEILATILRDFFPAIANDFPLLAPMIPTFIMPESERPLSGSRTLSHQEQKAKSLPPDAREAFRAFGERMKTIRPGASNNWAVRGEHTDSGRSFIAGDPHQGLRSPSLMWTHHMNSADAGGSIDVLGFSFVGSPTVQLGHNRHVAWTATTNYPDVMDLFSVPVADGVATVGGTPVAIETREERIEVRDGEAVTITVEWVPGFGLLLPDDLSPVDITAGDDRLMLSWPGFTPTREATSFLAFDLAGDLGDFESAVDEMEIGNFNFIAATADDILYRSAAQLPARPWASDAKPPYELLDGRDPEVLWRGELVDASLLPRSEGAERGWIASANNDPFGFTADSSLDGDAFYFGAIYDPGTRAARVEQELTRLIAGGPLTREQMHALQLDVHSPIADLLIPELEAVWATVDSDPELEMYRNRPELEGLFDSIAGWDRRMTRDSEAALTFHAFMSFAMRRTIADDLSIAFDAIVQSSNTFAIKMAVLTLTEQFENAPLFMQEGKGLILMGALEDTAMFLDGRAGRTWGDFHATTFGALWGDALDGGAHATDGADGTVNVSEGRFFDGEDVVDGHRSSGGAIFRLVTGFDEDGTPNATVCYPRGNSGEPDSPFYDNTLADWIEGTYAPHLFRTDAVMADSTVETVLAP